MSRHSHIDVCFDGSTCRRQYILRARPSTDCATWQTSRDRCFKWEYAEDSTVRDGQGGTGSWK